VSDATERLAVYRRFAEADTLKQVDELQAELRERFGGVPADAVTLAASSAITILGRQLGIRAIRLKGQQAQGDFNTEHVEQAGSKIIQSLSKAMSESGLEVQLMNNKALTFVLSSKPERNVLSDLRIFLECML
jgi:transcription-repair coupling factor (superfamily II helicase)